MTDTKVTASLSAWEENMVSELASQYDVPDEVVLNIGVTFLLNELSGSANGKQSLLNSIRPVGFDKSDVVDAG